MGNAGHLQPFAVDLILLHGREALDEHLCHAVAGIRDHSFLHILPYFPALSEWLGCKKVSRASVLCLGLFDGIASQ